MTVHGIKYDVIRNLESHAVLTRHFIRYFVIRQINVRFGYKMTCRAMSWHNSERIATKRKFWDFAKLAPHASSL